MKPNFLKGLLRRVLVLLRYIWRGCVKMWNWYRRTYKQARWYGKVGIVCATVVVSFVLYLILVDINFLWLFGKSPSLYDIAHPKQDEASIVYSADGKVLGRYYRENRIPVEYDEISPMLINALVSTEDERFYVLTLFAIAKELEHRKVPETLDPIDITLLVGLPPAHYEQLHSRFEQYFLRRREIVDFEYNGKYYSIRVSKVLSYPQAFAAAVTQFGTLKAHSVAYIIDIGGFTIDVLKLRSGHPDLAVVESFEKGVITLYNGIASKCNALYARILEDCDIDEVIRNQPTVLPGEVQQLIRTMTSDFLTEFYNFLRERGVDVSTSKCVFAGGGSLLLRGMIERGNKVAFPIFIEDIHANARGYELLYQSEVAANGQQ